MSLVYLLFFLSGATALVYQVVWVRSLTLVFGGSHQAVTAVLTIFMAGLALGGYLIGGVADRVRRPLRLYGGLELGIAALALAFMGLMRIYPALYAPLARGKDDATVYLWVVRTLFATVALIGPTTLMGGTLPVLARLVSGQPRLVPRSLSFLYGLNTLGAVLGALVASFVLLRLYTVSATFLVAIAANVLVGLLGVGLQARLAFPSSGLGPPGFPAPVTARGPRGLVPHRLVLWGIGVSGFCALGYEVLWTRVLAVAVGASVYGFTIMLVAFLTGIALGSKALGLLPGLTGGDARPTRPIAWFGVVQVVIGIAALVVTVALQDVPVNAMRLRGLFLPSQMGTFPVRVWSSFLLALLYMLVPAFFMGVAFPLAGTIHARYRGRVGRAVGEVLAWNTVGAILGAGISGFVLLRFLGIERSLELLALINIGTGLVVLASLRGGPRAPAVVAGVTLVAMIALAAAPTTLRFWDTRYFAVFRRNQPEAFRTPEMVREAVDNTDVLYYAEGTEAVVSVIRIPGGEQSFLTNGRVEASSHLQAQQVQLTLGHLPMLLARDPRKVLVVGLGSGMTAGATSIHPAVDQVTLAEIEPRVTGVARAFAAYNHGILDSPKLRLVFNDGRNFLLTTPETFDVITADPIHPWFRGAGYLYTAEYFRLVARHLTPGGVAAQWLPIYELTPEDLRSIVQTFRQAFPYALLWLTHYDAELVGSTTPLLVDEAEVARRLAAAPAVAADLRRVMMGSAPDLLSYFVMGAEGMARFAGDARPNTDDRLSLEFSAPFSIAMPAVMAANVRALGARRESFLPYLVAAAAPGARAEQRRHWDRQREAGIVGDQALALFLGGQQGDRRFLEALAELDHHYPEYAPGRFLTGEYQTALALEPRPLQVERLDLADAGGRPVVVEIHAVLVPVSRTRAAVMFVDNRARVVYGQRYLNGYASGDGVARVVADVMAAIRSVYRREAELSLARRQAPPPAVETLARIRQAIEATVGSAGPRS